MPDASDYVSSDSISWGKLIRDSAGTVILAYFMYVADVVSFVIDGGITAISSLGSWLEDLVDETVEVPLSGMQTALASMSDDIAGFGISGYIVAIVMLVFLFLVIIEVLSRVIGGR